jgi:hypothetical protein
LEPTLSRELIESDEPPPEPDRPAENRAADERPPNLSDKGPPASSSSTTLVEETSTKPAAAPTGDKTERPTTPAEQTPPSGTPWTSAEQTPPSGTPSTPAEQTPPSGTPSTPAEQTPPPETAITQADQTKTIGSASSAGDTSQGGPDAGDTSAAGLERREQLKWERMDDLGKLSQNEYGYLQPMGTEREAEAVDAPLPDHRVELAENPDGRAEPPPQHLAAFVGEVTPATLESGQHYYRIVGDGNHADGSWWTDTPPPDNAAVRRDLAVRNDYNGGGGLERFTPNNDMAIGWEGKVGPQWPTSGSGHLEGGGHQIWIPAGENGLAIDDGEWFIAEFGDSGGGHDERRRGG